MGWASGMRAGIDIGRAYNEGVERKRLEGIRTAAPEMSQGFTAEQGQQLEAMASAINPETGRPYYNVQAGQGGNYSVTPDFTEAQTPRTGMDTGSQYGVANVELQPTGLGRAGVAAQPIPFNQQQVTDFLGRRFEGELAPDRIEAMRSRAMAEGLSDPRQRQAALAEATRAEREAELAPLQRQQLEGSIAGQAQQRELTGIQIGGAKRAEKREVGFNTAFDEINKTEYKTPAERDAAILNAVERFRGPEAKAALQANYSTNERNRILTEGAKFDQTIKQARLKGPAAALKAIDDLNDSFKLEIDGFNVTQVNNDGTRVPFLQARNAEEFALGVDSRIKDGGAFELAKFRQDEQTNTARIEYFKSMTEKAKREGGAAANQLSGVTIGYSRDDKGNPIQVMSGLRFNKTTGALESVQVPLRQNVVPESALDPKKIAEQAEALISQPVDPTNKKSKVVHTFATAQQAVVDQIFNQYLGTGGSAGGLDLSPTAIAQRMLSGQPTPAAAATTAAPAPRQTGSMGLDPSRLRTDVNPVTGLPREAPASAPNLVEAASRGLDAGQARYVAYLEGKIASGQQLTRDEAMQARRFGLQ